MTKAESIYQKVSPNRILKVIALLYGAVAHAAFFVTMHYAARFIMSSRRAEEHRHGNQYAFNRSTYLFATVTTVYIGEVLLEERDLIKLYWR